MKLSGSSLALLALLASPPRPVGAAEWPYFRGPQSNNVSAETGLPSRWTRGGENMRWRAEWVGRSTPVVLDGRVYGKPADGRDAERMLSELSGRTHTVVSGLCLLGPELELVRDASTAVTFRAIAPELLTTYLASREWEGRAGAYAIQSALAGWIEHIDGSYSGIMGLPLAETAALLRQANVAHELSA